MPERKTTKLQDIAWQYVTRYWDRLHPEERLEFLTEVLTKREWDTLRSMMADKESQEVSSRQSL
jgi:hypothetical protein